MILAVFSNLNHSVILWTLPIKLEYQQKINYSSMFWLLTKSRTGYSLTESIHYTLSGIDWCPDWSSTEHKEEIIEVCFLALYLVHRKELLSVETQPLPPLPFFFFLIFASKLYLKNHMNTVLWGEKKNPFFFQNPFSLVWSERYVIYKLYITVFIEGTSGCFCSLQNRSLNLSQKTVEELNKLENHIHTKNRR